MFSFLFKPGSESLPEKCRRQALHKKGRSTFSFTPGFSRVIGNQEKRKPFKTVSSLCLAQFTWLKPGVNEIGLSPKEFDSLRFGTDFLCKAP